MAEALIALGGNVGDARATLHKAIDLFCDGTDVRLIARSHDYRTPPWGDENQAAFINLCLKVETGLTPQSLLERAQQVERMLGRVRAKRLLQRAFVLMPLAEIAPDQVIAGTRVRDALAQVDTAGIERLES
jgi:2-amino-4-hydroxy-6-hydroxymethyldihydropteridine diphosphokinase